MSNLVSTAYDSLKKEECLEEHIGKILRERCCTLSVAESCTGGKLSHLITSVSGSSSYYLGGVVSYATQLKNKILNVPQELIDKNGVVSSEVAISMALGVKELTGSTYSIATTGLAGPGGDGVHPVGTMYVGVAGPNGYSNSYLLSTKEKTRSRNIDIFSTSCLKLFLDYLLSTKP